MSQTSTQVLKRVIIRHVLRLNAVLMSTHQAKGVTYPAAPNIWIEGAQGIFKPNSSTTLHDPTQHRAWVLPPTTHGLSCIRRTTLAAVQWRSVLFSASTKSPDPLYNTTVLAKLEGELSSTNPFLSIIFQNTRLASLLRQCARYLDSWNEEIHLRPNLDDYEAFGLVSTIRPTSNLESNTTARAQLIRIASTAILLDGIMEAEVFFAHQSTSFVAAACRTEEYSTSIDLLRSRTNFRIYQSTESLPEKSAAKVCRSTLEWKLKLENALKVSNPGPSQEKIIYPAFSDVPNELLADISRGDGRKNELVAELNVKRGCFSLLTLWGLLDVK